METPNALSEWRSTRRPWRRKYRVASQGNSPIRVLNVQTMSSAPEVTYNNTGWHVPSKHSSAAPTPALDRWRYRYHAYIITLWKYHGHKGRGTTTARSECGSTALGGSLFCRFFFYYYYILSGPNYSEGLSGNTLAEHTMQQPAKNKPRQMSRWSL